MRINIQLTILFLIFSFSAFAQKDIAEEQQKANETRQRFLEKDPEMSSFFSTSYAYLIFPSVGKGGLGVGGAGGNGTVYLGGNPVARASLAQVTIGFQAGGQSFSEVVFFENAEAFENFKEGKIKVSAQVSAVAATAGASADAPYKDGISIFTMAIGGLMYEASVGGQKLKYKEY